MIASITFIPQLKEIQQELPEVILPFSNERFNVIPYTDGWSAGMVAEHIRISAGGMLQTINGSYEKTERQPDENIESIKTGFQDLSVKMKSPDFVVPEQKNYDKEVMAAELDNIFKGLIESAETLDLSVTCRDFALPVMGYLTRLEFLAFVVYHTQRHIHQLKKIAQMV